MKNLKIDIKKLKEEIDSKAKIVMTISIFLVCLLLVLVMSIQFKTVKEVNQSDIENLRETELREKISTWKSKYEDTHEKLEEVNKKIEEYYAEVEEKGEASSVLENELQQSELLVGNTEVYGEGVEVTLYDTQEASITASDLVELVNELKFAGAEAISINNIRVINMTDIVDIADKFILIKPRQRLSSPYVVKAIGNQTYLSSTLSLKNSGYIDRHINSGQNITLEKQKNIVIPKYSWDLEVKYMKEVESK